VRDVGDMDLEEPDAVLTTLDVNGIVKVARGFAVDGDNGKLAEVFATGAFGFGDRRGETFGFLLDFAREEMREMVFADNDFGVHTEVAGAAENFDDAPARGGATARVAKEFNIDDGSIEFRDVGEALAARRMVFGSGQQLFAESRRKLVTRRELDFVLDARVVWQNTAAARSVTKLADDGGMSPADDADNTALGAAGAGLAAQASDFGDDVVAVHGIFDGITGNENVAIHIGKSDVGNDEAVTVLMKDEAAFDLVARCGLMLRELLGDGLRRRRAFALGTAKQETAVGELLDEAPFFEHDEHLEKGTTVVFFDLEPAREVLEGNGIASKLQKTKDIVGAEVSGGRHHKVPFWERRKSTEILAIFLKFAVTFFGFRGFHR